MRSYITAAVLALSLGGSSLAYAQATPPVTPPLASGEVTGASLIAGGGTQVSGGIMVNGTEYYPQADGGYSTQVPPVVAAGEITGGSLLADGGTQTSSTVITLNGVKYYAQTDGGYSTQQPGAVGPTSGEVTGLSLISQGGVQNTVALPNGGATVNGILLNGTQYYVQADGGYSTQPPTTTAGTGSGGGTGSTTPPPTLASGEVAASDLLSNGGTQTANGIMYNGTLFYLQADGGYSTQAPGGSSGSGGTTTSSAPPSTAAQLIADGGELEPGTTNYIYQGQVYMLQPNGSYAVASVGSGGSTLAQLLALGGIQVVGGVMYNGQLYTQGTNGIYTLASAATTVVTPPVTVAQTVVPLPQGVDPMEDNHGAAKTDYRLSCPYINTDPTVNGCRVLYTAPTSNPPY